MLRLLRRVVVALVLVPAAIWLGLILVTCTGIGPRVWWLELIDTFVPYAFAPFVGVLVVGALLRSRSLAVLVAAASMLFVVLFGWALVPRTPPTDPAGPHLKILTYNLRSPNSNPDPLLELIEAERPDVVVLQELTGGYVERLTPRVAEAYPSFLVAGTETANDGAGVYSRLPILEHEAFRLSDEGNVIQRVRLRTDTGDLWLVNVHLASPRLEARRLRGGPAVVPLDLQEDDRDAELTRLIAEVRALAGPFVLAGDFNTAAGSRANRAFPAAWRDAYRDAGDGFGHTFPTGLGMLGGRFRVTSPLVRIDYVLTSPELTPRSARVPRIAGSDHLPVVADLGLPPSR